MEDSQPTNSNPSYWTSVAIAGLLFGIIVFAISIIAGYVTINSEPTGSMFSPMQLIGIVACLVGAFGGMLAVWHYAKEYDVAVKVGKGALIGFLAGVAIIVVNIVLGQIWDLIDPDMTQQMIDSVVANIEASEMADEQKQQTIDMMVESLRNQEKIGQQLLWGIPIYGILNLFTGMLGAAIFGKKEEQF